MPGTDLQGRHVLVTGAGKGIGRATALAAAQEGADVSLVGTTQGNLEEVAALIRDQGRQARVYTLDVSDGEAVGRCIADAADAFGGLHGAFNNAGIDGALAPTADYPEEDFDRVLQVNIKACGTACVTSCRS